MPTLRRRRLGERLREYRNTAGLNLEQAAEAMGEKWDSSKLSRIENAKAKISAADVTRVLHICGVEDPKTIAAMEALARDAGKTGWWANYATAPYDLQDLISAQSDAESIRQYQPNVLPGLLQTGAYAREVTAATAFNRPQDEHAAIAELRVVRQNILTRPGNAVSYWAVINESLLHQRFVSHPSLMREQLRHLIDMSDLPNITIQVMPLTAGPHPGASGTFAITQFSHPWPSLVTIEHRAQMQCLEDREEVRNFETAFDKIRAAALPDDQSRETIRTIMEGH
ncbi:helix-turn-helix transcriptional regulator [Kitasatospora sp. NBC_01287]|uniref:helix-turn-helix domain-containing protein n=1 Tax=Kitasatospora sp. NBC_01287 TaxID=2903573 RepID=UPI00225149E4|nr:helix-turn-helix transcriptional regulator [Kitasatospora sp. NBC_01287]MCX4745543.1 helix-turn-helix transcriptional regulator [Kitasatospora sp. NBC_01287]